jgi:copper resistance protein D
LNDPLVAVRAIHFISTMIVGGAIFFQIFVADPALRGATVQSLSNLAAFHKLLNRILWINLAVALDSWAAWFLVVCASIADKPILDVFSDDIVWTVLTETQFGLVWIARSFLSLSLAGWLSLSKRRNSEITNLSAVVSASLAAGLLGTLAWTGHAAATPGTLGGIHLVSDFLHIIFASAWVGGLLPLALLLAFARRQSDPVWHCVANIAVRRFSMLGIASVTTILATGIINTLVLVGSVAALIESDYGRLLLLKIASFVALVCIAAFNLLMLAPHTVTLGTKRLERNTLIEAGLGFIVAVIVSTLGTMAPAAHALHSH